MQFKNKWTLTENLFKCLEVFFSQSPSHLQKKIHVIIIYVSNFSSQGERKKWQINLSENNKVYTMDGF